MPTLNEIYWENRYKNAQTGWDTGHASPALTDYTAQWPHKNAAVLIPGCGNAHEAEAMLEQGFTNLTLLDIAESPLNQIAEKFKHAIERKHLKLVHQDFFEHQEKYALILEQTFFCAIPPHMRESYAETMHQRLDTDGKLAGLLFNFPLTNEGPPYGGASDEYLRYFSPYFDIETMENSLNSIKPRAGKELFFILKKKNASTIFASH